VLDVVEAVHLPAVVVVAHALPAVGDLAVRAAFLGPFAGCAGDALAFDLALRCVRLADLAELSTRECALLFPGGVGNTQKDPERFRSLYEGVISKIFDVLPDETWIYPGHGKDTTLGAERPHLEEWRERGW